MANALQFRVAELVFLLLWTNLQFTISTPINIPLQSVNNEVLQSGLNSLTFNAPSHPIYKDGTLINAQKLVEPSYNTAIYALTFNFIPNEGCNGMNSCFEKTCTIDVTQYQSGIIEPQVDSIKCIHSYYQAIQEEITDERRIIDDLNEQIVEKNSRVKLNHEVETTGDENEKPFIAVRASTKSPYCPNCPTELNPTLPGLITFGEDVVKSMDESIPNDYKHKLKSIVRVVRVVPISSDVVQYQFIMEISESTCMKNALIDQADCSFKPDSEIKRCFVVFEEQPWKQPPNRRLTRNNCTEFGDAETEKKQFINENSRDMVRENDERPLIRVQLNKSEMIVNEQIIPKFQDKIKEFDEFLEDFDLPIRRGTDDNVASGISTTGVPVVEEYIQPERVEDKLNRQKRSTPETKNDDLITKLAQKATDESKGRGEFREKKRTVVGILKSNAIPEANSVIYHITAKVGTDNDELSSMTQICDMMIYTLKKDPLKVSKTLKYECRDEEHQNERGKRSVRLGGPTPIDSKDPQIVEYAKRGLSKLAEELQSENELMLTEVVNATTQVVAGTKYTITVRYGPADCPKGTTENCQLKSDGEIKECTISVWSRPWLNKEEISSDCKNARSVREKRTLRGKNYSQKMLQQAHDFKPELTFEHFITKYNKTYSSVKEMEDRREIFHNNLKRIKEFQENEQGDAVYGITIFADLTEKEFKTKFTGLRPDLRMENEIPLQEADIPDIQLPTEFDWRHYNIVTPVKNQGSCGSCWAFSVTGNVEGMYARKHGKLLSLSEQELVDCDKLDEGCNGGLPDNAYRAIESLGGLELESDYPYEGENEKCHFDKNQVRVQVVSGLNITSNETKMAQWLVQNGPISIGINANAMQFYVGGISHPLKFLCSPKNLDHGVLIVGYGIREYPLFHKKYPFWIIKNSWGPHWGEQGYYRIYRGDGSCGVNQMATSAVVA